MFRQEKLQNVAKVFNGKTPSRAQQQSFGHPVLKIKDVDEFGEFKGEFGSFVDNALVQKYKQKTIQEGDVLILNAAHNADYVGTKVYFSQPSVVGALATGEWLMIRADPKVLDRQYLYYWITSSYSKHQIRDMVKGIHLYPRDVAISKIPLPPLAEQQRIAAILDKADALRAQRRAALAKLDTLLQSTFLHLFGDPVTNPMGWEVVKAGEVINDIVAGASYGGEQRELEPDELGVLKISAVTTGQFDPTEFKAVKISDIKKDVIKPKKGDILFSRANTREMVAATCIVDKDYDYLFLPDKLWRIDFDENRCINWYFKLLLSHEGFRYHLTKTATGTSGSMLNISKAKLRSLRMPLPPIELQTEFSKCVDRIEYQNKQLKCTSEKLDNLFHALQQRAFHGQLSL